MMNEFLDDDQSSIDSSIDENDDCVWDEIRKQQQEEEDDLKKQDYEENQIMTTVDRLKQHAQKYEYEKDLLLEDNDYDVDEDILDLLEDSDYSPKYLTEEKLKGNIPNISFDDIFIIKPERHRHDYKKKEGIGYMLTRLKNLESLYIHQLFFKYNIDVKMRSLNLASYIYELNQICGLLLVVDKSDHEFVYLLLYILMCKTFLKPNSENDDKKFIVMEKKIVFLKKIMKENVTKSQIEFLETKKILYKVEKENENENIFCLTIIIPIEKYLEMFDDDVKIGFNHRQNLDVQQKSTIHYLELLKKHVNKSKDEEFFKELLDEL